MEELQLMESGSSIGTFMDCPKKYEFQYIKRLSSSHYPQTMVFGSFIHALAESVHQQIIDGIVGATTPTGFVDFPQTLCSLMKCLEQDPNHSVLVEQFYQNEQLEKLLKESTENPTSIEPLFPKAFHKTLFRDLNRTLAEYESNGIQIVLDAALALAVHQEWLKHWSSRDGDFGYKKWQITRAESEWGISINENLHVGKSDAYVFHKGYEKNFLYELKTSGDPSREAYKHKLELDKQINSNLIAMKEAGFEPAGVIYDIIWKPAIKLKKDRKTMPDETIPEFYQRIFECYQKEPEKYFERLMVFRSDKDFAEYKLDVVEQFGHIHRCYERGRFYRNTNSCEKFGKLCQFFNPCLDSRNGEVNEEVEALYKVREKKLPELSSELQKGKK